jgi:hypothetical protein
MTATVDLTPEQVAQLNKLASATGRETEQSGTGGRLLEDEKSGLESTACSSPSAR